LREAKKVIPASWQEVFRWTSKSCESSVATKENKWQLSNATRWHNKAYDNLFHADEGQLDPVKRAALFIAMNDMVVEDG
jgi:peptide/nickel transport system substrate-binding protein